MKKQDGKGYCHGKIGCDHEPNPPNECEYYPPKDFHYVSNFPHLANCFATSFVPGAPGRLRLAIARVITSGFWLIAQSQCFGGCGQILCAFCFALRQ